MDLVQFFLKEKTSPNGPEGPTGYGQRVSPTQTRGLNNPDSKKKKKKKGVLMGEATVW
jgi:hypothetical protein